MENIIRCDENGCGWEQPCELKNMGDWYNKPCPKCGKGVIINTEELFLAGMLNALKMQDDMLGPELPRETIHIDSAKLCREEK